MSGPSPADLRALLAKWKAYEAVSSNPGECEDDAFANGTEWGMTLCRVQLGELLKSYGEPVK